MSGIFISYRRDDSMGFAGRIEDDLSERFGDELIFRDRDIQAGDDFTHILRETLASIDAMLVVIGRGWENACDRDGQLRLHHENDWVRLEIENALDRKVPVIPVLVGGASMPQPEKLPASLAEFSKRQAFPLSDRRWREEIDELARQLTRFSPILKVRLNRVGHINESDSVADAIRDIGDRVIDEAMRGREKNVGNHQRSKNRRAFFPRMLRKLFGFSIIITVLYVVIRTNGGAKLNRDLDRIIAQLTEQFQNLF